MPGESNEGTLTINRIVDESLDAVYGYTRDQAQVTSLGSGFSASDTTFTIAEPGQVSRGLIEVDDELMYVKSVDNVSGTVTVQPWGRAQSGTTAAAHSAGAKVTMAPLYPRQRVRDQIYAVLREIHPDVAPVGEFFVDVNVTRSNYPTPDDCYNVLRLEWNLPGPSLMWAPVKRWRTNKTATTVEIELIGPAWPGPNRVRGLYMKNLPDTLAADENLTALGYPQDLHGVLVLGAVYKLLAFTEPSRLQVQSVQASSRAELVPAGSISNTAKFVYNLYQQRLENLRFWYAERYPLLPKQTW